MWLEAGGEGTVEGDTELINPGSWGQIVRRSVDHDKALEFYSD